MKKIVFLSLIILSLNSILIQTIFKDNDIFKNSMRLIVVLMLLIGIVIYRKKINRNIVILILISTICLITGKNTDQLTYIFLFIMIQSLLYIEEEKIEKYMCIGSLVPIIVMFLFLLTGVTHNQIVLLRDRMTFGLPTNRVPYVYDIVYGALSTLYIYSYNKYSKIKKILVFMICITLGTFFFIKTDVRGAYISLIILILLSLIMPKIIKYKFTKIFIKALPIMFFGFILILLKFQNNEFMNKVLSLRPMYTGEFFKKISYYDVFITRSVKAFTNTSIIDNTYIQMLIGGGIVLTLIIIYMYFKSIDNLIKNNKIIELCFIVSLMFYFNIESIGLRPENIFSIFWWYLIIKYGLCYKDSMRSVKDDSSYNCDLQCRR